MNLLKKAKNDFWFNICTLYGQFCYYEIAKKAKVYFD